MSEKSILAYFKSPEEAEGVAKKLRALRVIDLSIDRFSRFPGASMYSSGPFTGGMPSLTLVTYGTTYSDKDVSILAAADPSASGMSDGGQGGPTGRDIILSVVVEEESFEKARRIVEEAGGFV